MPNPAGTEQHGSTAGLANLHRFLLILSSQASLQKECGYCLGHAYNGFPKGTQLFTHCIHEIIISICSSRRSQYLVLFDKFKTSCRIAVCAFFRLGGLKSKKRENRFQNP